jgi:hypothetical protein
MKMKFKISALTFIAAVFFSLSSSPYPIDGYDYTKIPRLYRLELIMSGELKDPKPVIGAQKSIKDIKLNLLNAIGDSLAELPEPTPEFQRSINNLFPNLNENYSISVLDITPGREIRYATRKDKNQYQPGSVGKIAVAAGLFAELQKIYPYSFEKRHELLKKKFVRAGKWAMYDEHTVPILM